MKIRLTRKCMECNGLGKLHLSSCFFYRCVITCPNCKGHGYVIEEIKNVVDYEVEEENWVEWVCG